MQDRHKDAALGEDGVVQLLRHYRIDVDFPAQTHTLEQKVAWLNERTSLILTPMALENGWHRTSSGTILAIRQDGVACALFPDRLGRYYFNEGDMRRRRYVTARSSVLFKCGAYAVSTGLPEKTARGGLLRRLAGGIGAFETGLLLLWCVLGCVLIGLMGAQIYRVLAAAAMSPDRSALLEPAGLLAAELLMGLLLLYSGRRMVERIAQERSLDLLPAIGERLYMESNPVPPAVAAAGLASARDDGEHVVGWLIRLACGTLIGLGTALRLAFLSGGMTPLTLAAAAVLTFAAALVFVRFGRADGADRKAEKRYEWLCSRTSDKRFGVRHSFPFGGGTGVGGPGVLLLLAPLLLTPVLWTALRQEIPLARLMQLLVLALPAAALPLGALAKAPAAGRALGRLSGLLSRTEIKTRTVVELPPMGSVLELKNVTFSYPGQREPVLRDVSLRIRPGETVGICGATASGKTTLAQLMAGLLTPDSGNVYYGGIELSRFDREALLRRISLNGEDIRLFEEQMEEPFAGTAVVFSARESGLSRCGRVFRLTDGVLQAEDQKKAEGV